MIGSLIVLAAAEAAAPGTSDWISGPTLIQILTVVAGGGGIVYGARKRDEANRKESEIRRRVEEELRTKITGEVKAEIPQPCTVEQSSFQAYAKKNEKDHTDLFDRLRKLESEHSALASRFDTTFQFITKQLDSLTQMTSQLLDHICKRGDA